MFGRARDQDKSYQNIVRRPFIAVLSVDDYAKDGGPGEVWLLCSFYHGPLRTWIETNVSKFAISNHTALKLDVQALRSYLSIFVNMSFISYQIKKVSTAKDYGKNYMKDRPLRSAIFCVIVYWVNFGTSGIVQPGSSVPKCLLRQRIPAPVITKVTLWAWQGGWQQ